MAQTLFASQQASPYAGIQQYASYWLTNQPSLTSGDNVLFNLQQAPSNIDYDSTTGIFTVPPGAYAINFFATPDSSFDAVLNLNTNGTIIPDPGIAGSMVVVNLPDAVNQISVQATDDWSPMTGDIGSYFFAYASIAIYKVGTSNLGKFACLSNSAGQTLTTGQNVLFEGELSLQGVVYDVTTGVLTLPPGTYSVSYFSGPTDGLNLVANGTIIPNSPLNGCATTLTLSNAANTLSLQALSSVTLPPSTGYLCSAMITVYQVN